MISPVSSERMWNNSISNGSGLRIGSRDTVRLKAQWHGILIYHWNFVSLLARCMKYWNVNQTLKLHTIFHLSVNFADLRSHLSGRKCVNFSAGS